PAVQRNPPVLTPALDETIVLEHGFRRSSPTPFQIEIPTTEEHVRRTPAHTDRDVTHEFHPHPVRVTAHRRPLSEGNPLHPGVELEPAIDRQCVLAPCGCKFSAGFR